MSRGSPPTYPAFRETQARRAERRRRVAVDRALQALDRLRARGVEARVTGSLAQGRFGTHSDVDLLILELPDEALRYRIETDVEAVMGDIPFDVIYLDELQPPTLRQRMLEKAVDRAHLAGHRDRA